MEIHKNHIDKLVDLEEQLRNTLLRIYYDFDFSKIVLYQSLIPGIQRDIQQLLIISEESSDALFFKHYQYLINAVTQLIHWVNASLEASANAVAHLQSAKINSSLIDTAAYHYPDSFRQDISQIQELISAVDQPLAVRPVFAQLSRLVYPCLYAVEVNPIAQWRKKGGIVQEEAVETKEKETVVSIEFFIDQEPWANPQVLQPVKIYSLKGEVKVNEWPDGFDRLILHPISAESQSHYILDLPVIFPFKDKSRAVNGTVTFKYPQHNFEDNLSVRLLCYFQKPNGEKKLPVVIGYDQLIAKVLDPQLHDFMTGFSSMSDALFDIALNLQRELPRLDQRERNNFLTLLRGILNYQGYCLQRGIYKNQSQVPEREFRDRLVQHLHGLPYLGDEVIQEAELAGGRVEISYRGIIAELKSEAKISDRKQLIQKYGQQPVAYASGNGKQLSILCILDTTEKTRPPAPPRNNIITYTPEVHGHMREDLEFPPRQVAIIIDGNTKGPSEYSKR